MTSELEVDLEAQVGDVLHATLCPADCERSHGTEDGKRQDGWVNMTSEMAQVASRQIGKSTQMAEVLRSYQTHPYFRRRRTATARRRSCVTIA